VRESQKLGASEKWFARSWKFCARRRKLCSRRK
jgi:hypothetical protein